MLCTNRIRNNEAQFFLRQFEHLQSTEKYVFTIIQKEKKEIGNLGLPDSVRQVLKDSSTYHFFDLMTLSVQ